MGGRLYLSLKWSQLSVHFFRQMPIMKKRRKNSKFLTVRLAVGPSLKVHFADIELNLEIWCGIMLELRLNITERKILHSTIGIMEILSTLSLFLTVHSSKTFKVVSYLPSKSTKVKAFLLFNACQEHKHYRR